MSQNRLELEVSRHSDRLKVGLVSNRSGLETLRRYYDKKYRPAFVSEKCTEALRLMHNMNLRGPLGGELLSRLQGNGFGLFEELLPVDIQQEISSFDGGSLVFNIDDGMVQIPWELFYDGRSFFCLKYSTGRIVRTRHKVRPAGHRKIADPLSMLILCNPGNDLQRAYDECDRIRNELDRSSRLIHADLLNRRVDLDTLKAWIRNYDILHFAGHADYDRCSPENSGWLLQDGKLTPAEIRQMSTRLPLPSMIFSNACRSAQTAAWSTDSDLDEGLHSLAQAFLMSGVRHYLGTCWEVLDDAGCDFATYFYQSLLSGLPVGESVRQARRRLAQSFGPGNIAWAGYILYGSPEASYFKKTDICAKNAKGSKPADASVSALSARGATRSLPMDRKTFNLSFLTYTAILAALIVSVYLFTNRQHPPDPSPTSLRQPVYSGDTPEETNIAEVLEALSNKYAQQQKSPPSFKSGDPWTTLPATLSISGFKCIGRVPGIYQAEHALTAGLTRSLIQGGRFLPVERQQLINILTELQISTSDIADQNAALTILGRLVGARYVAAGELVETSDRLAASLRLIETSTSRIVFSAFREFSENEIELSAAALADDCTDAMRRHAPIKGRIVKIDPGTAVVNIGTEHGVRPGMIFDVLPKDHVSTDDVSSAWSAGRLPVNKTYKNYSLINFDKTKLPLEIDMKIIETGS